MIHYVSKLVSGYGRSDWIRTSGLLNPIQARYQTSPHPVICKGPALAKTENYNTTNRSKMQYLFEKYLNFLFPKKRSPALQEDGGVEASHFSSDFS